MHSFCKGFSQQGLTFKSLALKGGSLKGRAEWQSGMEAEEEGAKGGRGKKKKRPTHSH